MPVTAVGKGVNQVGNEMVPKVYPLKSRFTIYRYIT